MGRKLADQVNVHAPVGASIATTSTTDTYFQAPRSGRLLALLFGSLAALTAHDSNYITWTMTNLGQAGAGTTEMLKSDDLNTTKLTGGVGITASAKKALVLSDTLASRDVVEGDTIRLRATATGTLAGAVTVPRYTALFHCSGA